MDIADEGRGGIGEFENVSATKGEEVIELPIRDGKSDDSPLIGTVSILKSAIPERPDWLLSLGFEAFVSGGAGQYRTIEDCKLVEFFMIKDSEFIGLEASLEKHEGKPLTAITAPECSKKLDAQRIELKMRILEMIVKAYSDGQFNIKYDDAVKGADKLYKWAVAPDFIAEEIEEEALCDDEGEDEWETVTEECDIHSYNCDTGERTVTKAGESDASEPETEKEDSSNLIGDDR